MTVEEKLIYGADRMSDRCVFCCVVACKRCTSVDCPDRICPESTEEGE